MKKQRMIGLDILRILAMIGIIILHINGSGGLLDSCKNAQSQHKYWVIWWVEVCAYTSVDIFGLLSGYLGIKRESKSSVRVIQLAFTVLFYCIIITLLFGAVFPNMIKGFKDIVKGIFPVLDGRYWYITNYIPVALLQPYINKMLISLTQKEHFKLSVIIICIFGFAQSFIKLDMFSFKVGYSFVWLLCLYIIGAYFGRFNVFEKWKKRSYMISFLLMSLLLVMGNIIIYRVFDRNLNYFVSYISPITLAMAICMLLFFEKIEIKKGTKLLVFLSSVAFDVYILHCHIFVFDYLVTDSFNWISMFPILSIPIIIILISFCCFFVLGALGGLREKVFKIIRLDELIKILSQKIDRFIY